MTPAPESTRNLSEKINQAPELYCMIIHASQATVGLLVYLTYLLVLRPDDGADLRLGVDGVAQRAGGGVPEADRAVGGAAAAC